MEEDGGASEAEEEDGGVGGGRADGDGEIMKNVIGDGSERWRENE
jgi:hypothetical protein